MALGVRGANGVTCPRIDADGGVGVGPEGGVGVGVGGGAPVRLTRPIFWALISVNQMLPSGPAQIWRGLVRGAQGNSVSVPEGGIRPVAPVPAYQTLPSGPRVMQAWVVALAAVNWVMAPAVVIRLTLRVVVNQMAPSGPAVIPVSPKLPPSPGITHSVMHCEGVATQPLSFVRSIRATR